MADGGDHRQPLPGDGGLRFAQADGDGARRAFAAWERFAAAAVAVPAAGNPADG